MLMSGRRTAAAGSDGYDQPPAPEGVWLDPKLTNTAEALTLLTPYAADAMITTPVSTTVNTASSEAPKLILPIASAER